MGGVLGSATVSERLKMRKSLGIYYYQDIVFDAEVNNNATNIRGVSTSFIILYYFWLQSYTNADLKISLYILFDTKVLPWKFCILNRENSRVIYFTQSLGNLCLQTYRKNRTR